VTDPLNPLLLSGIPVHDNAAWRSPWDGVVTSIATASYALCTDGRVAGVCVRSTSNNPNTLTLAYAASESAFLGGDGTMVVDRALVTATGGSTTQFRSMSGGLCRDPDDPSTLLLTWNRVGSGATWTYGTGFPAPSQGDVNRTYIYESADDGATWTELAHFYYDSTGSSGNVWGNGPVQKFGSLYLLTALTRWTRRHIWSSTDKVTWTHRFVDNSGAGVGPGIAHIGGKFYNWGESGLASSSDGLSWTRYDTSVTGQGGPSFTYSLDGGATVRHGVIRRPSSGVSTILRWESTTTADPVPGDFATDETYNSTGYSLNALWHPFLLELSSSRALIVTGPRIFGVELAPDVDTYPALSVEVAYVNDPTDTSWTWEDITPWVKKITTRVGRDRELDDFEPGRATLVLDNTDRRFDPEHATGPYYGDLLPSKRVRIRATHKTVTYTLFHGFVDDWPQDYSGAWESEVVVPCTDAFGQLARVTLPTSVYAAEVMADTPWAWWRFQEGAGQTVADSSGNGRELILAAQTLDQWEHVETPVKDPTATALTEESAPTTHFFFQDDVFPGSAQFTVSMFVRGSDVSGWDSYYNHVLFHLLSESWSVGLGEFGGTVRKYRATAGNNSTGTNYRRTNSDVTNDGRWQHIMVRVDGSTGTGIVVNGVQEAVTTVGAIPTPPDIWRWAVRLTGVGTYTGTQPAYSGAVGEVVIFDQNLSAVRCGQHYNAAVTPWNNDLVGARINRIYSAAGWPSGLRSTATGLTALGPAHLDSQNALAYLRSTANAEQGQLFCDMANEGKVTFLDRHDRLTAARSTDAQYVFSDEDDPDSIHYERIDLKRDGRDVINSVTVKWTGGEATSTDAASIATYGLKSHTVSTELGSRIEAENMGEWIIGRYGRPVARCRSLELNPAAYFPAFTAALDTRINDRATVRKLPGSVGDPIELDAIVEGIEHHIDAGVNVWTTRLRLSQADAGPWWIPDVGVPDTSTRPAW